MQLDGKRVLVTGGAGFIGTHVTQELVEAGADVHVIDNMFAGGEAQLPADASFTVRDIRSKELQEDVTEFKPDAIIHLAALHYIPYCNEHPEDAFTVNVMGTRNLLRATSAVPNLESILYTSSAAVYPPREGAMSETSDVGPIDIYGRTKLIGEDLLRLFAAQADTAAVTARLFNVYGPNDTNPHLIPAILEQVRDGAETIELGNLAPKRDFVYVRDVARALVTLVSNPQASYRAFNVGTGSTYSVREVVECVGTALGKDLDVVQVAERTRETERPHLEADIDRIRSETGWTPQTELVEGIRRQLNQEQISS
ncbi:NAD-dependent epimerase/dehydratase family protein [Halorussus salinisoli]|uniref:NAD-dependent epimerase/dehydratase family protein n=1 Tax=Halorussus salinisoli TaxID=2558242 RepID=UPI0010C1FC24|nr:NAD(P)-dependent oxidoreductase [Halorussus salinisoli]